MSYLEKLFLGTMALFALAMLFMFGLYFDIGDMFRGGLDQAGQLTRGAAVDRVIDSLERAARRAPAVAKRREDGRPVRNTPTFVCASRTIADRYKRLFGAKPERMELKVAGHKKFLLSQGFTNEEFIEMEALAQDREAADRALREVNTLMVKGNAKGAAAALERALTELDPKNHVIRSEILQKLLKLYLAQNELEKAKHLMREMIGLQEKILLVRSNSKLMSKPGYRQGVETGLDVVRKQMTGIDSAFDDLERRKQETGRWDGYTAEERSNAKASLLEARSAGEITQQEFDEGLAELDGGFSKIPNLRKRAEAALDKE